MHKLSEFFRNRVAVMFSLLAVVGAFLIVAPAMAFATASDNKVCPTFDTGHVNPGNNKTSVTVTAPANKKIISYCVKAGSANQGLGAETKNIAPTKTVTFSHSSGKDISHYSLRFITSTDPTTPAPTTPPVEPKNVSMCYKAGTSGHYTKLVTESQAQEDEDLVWPNVNVRGVCAEFVKTYCLNGETKTITIYDRWLSLPGEPEWGEWRELRERGAVEGACQTVPPTDPTTEPTTDPTTPPTTPPTTEPTTPPTTEPTTPPTTNPTTPPTTEPTTDPTTPPTKKVTTKPTPQVTELPKASPDSGDSVDTTWGFQLGILVLGVILMVGSVVGLKYSLKRQ